MKNKIKILALSLLLVSCGGMAQASTNSHYSFLNPNEPHQSEYSSTNMFNSNYSSEEYKNNFHGMKDENPHVQGIDHNAKKIYVGNTAATTGAFKSVGVPFNVGIESALYAFNQAGGYKGYTVELKHYDDSFAGDVGLAYTEKLVEEDKVFALVGHFGTNTVSATLDYIEETGVPMVYAATGISGLFNAKAKGNERAIMSVQPIYDAEGEVMLARAVASTYNNMGLGAKKVGVISTTDDAGSGMLKGIKTEATKLGVSGITYVETSAAAGTNHSTAVSTLKKAGCDVVIVAANQVPFMEIMAYFNSTGYDNVKVITSYVSANATQAQTMFDAGSVTDTREVYVTAWLDIADANYVYAPSEDNATGTALWNYYKAYAEALGVPGYYDAGFLGLSAEYWGVAEDIYEYTATIDAANAFVYSSNSYAIAGYIAGFMFVQGLERLEEANVELTWGNYYNAMEIDVIDFPMGGTVNYANGRRAGSQDLALNKYGKNAYTGAGELYNYSPITSLYDVESAK